MKKVCFIASSGGHLTQIQKLKPIMDRYDSFLVTEYTGTDQEFELDKVYYLKQVNRKEAGFIPIMILDTFKSLKIFIKESIIFDKFKNILPSLLIISYILSSLNSSKLL